MTLVLPTTPKVAPPPTIDGSSLLVIGAPKTGKSSFANSFGGLVLDTQRGYAQLGGLIVEVASLNDVRTIYKQLLANPGAYKAVVIDTLDDISTWMEAEAVQWVNNNFRNNKPSLSSITECGFNGWVRHRELMLDLIRAFLALPMTKIVIAHSTKLIDEEAGESTKMIDLPKGLANKIPAFFDSVGVSYRDENGRYMISWEGFETRTKDVENKHGEITKRGKLIVVAGSRFAGLQGRQTEATAEAVSAAVRGG